MARIQLVNPKGGYLTYMAKANPRSRNRTARRSHKNSTVRLRSRASNPGYRRKRTNAVMRHHRRHNPVIHNRHHSRRHRNPVPGFDQLTVLIMQGLFALFGGVVARSLPEWVMSSSNTGITGYFYNFAVTIAEWYMAHSFGVDSSNATAMGVGGFAFTASRIIQDYFGTQTITFPSIGPSGQPTVAVATAPPAATLGALAGSDSAFSFGSRPRRMRGVGGMYNNANFVLPTNSLGAPRSLPAPGQTQAQPAASASPATAGSDPWGGGGRDLWS